MLEDAQTTIVVGRVKAGVGFGLGFILLVCAVFLFVKWKKALDIHLEADFLAELDTIFPGYGSAPEYYAW